MASPTPAPAAAGKPAPATEFYKGKVFRTVAVLVVLWLAIAMIVRSCASHNKASVGISTGEPAKMIGYSTEPPIRFGSSKSVELDLKTDEWSPYIETPERCKGVYWTINPPAGYKIRFADGSVYEAGPNGLGFIPEKRMVFRLLGAQPGQKAVVHVTY